MKPAAQVAAGGEGRDQSNKAINTPIRTRNWRRSSISPTIASNISSSCCRSDLRGAAGAGQGGGK
ncbi:hypothetical protein TSOC_010092 [Tetrabaena socialis]|uniref:Uncharacterized protein n=1 Tax=Tetrabaena socialis TaxID=47790 RepID=A0A2J7ZU73_9CHLO|nr:hypothetical protein TSOC_010092 [Tetrabaena socialis]|eukprot:PNH03825.1 hypothetical protein TSOC_010092 [Tetrabaena socialis]